MFLGLSIAAAVPFAWYFLRSDESAVTKKPARPARKAMQKQQVPGKAARRSFKGASIKPGDNCCKAAQEMSNTRFLTEEAPRLPLEGCDRVADCLCKYHNHPDRRSGDDRRNIYGSLSTVGEIGRDEINNRTGMDRRASIDAELENIDFEI
jgi:hypothetical protein